MSVFNRENRLLSWFQLLALVGIIGLVDWLLWIWLKIPTGSASPMLEVMSLWGFAFVAGLTSFGIGVVGIHMASRSQKQ